VWGGDKKKDAAPAAADPHKTEHRSDAQILKKILGKAEAAKVVKRIGVPWDVRGKAACSIGIGIRPSA